MIPLLVPFLFLAFVAMGANTPWTCSSYAISLTKNAAMTPVTCTCTTSVKPRIAPTLPAGLIYTVTSDTSNNKVITISGTPSVGLQKTVFSVGYNSYVSTITLEIFGAPTSLSYGFDSMTLFVGVDLEPIPPQIDAAVSSFSSNPNLPSGLQIDATSGVISGKVPSVETSGQVYTITATYNGSPVTTTVKFLIQDSIEMSRSGFTACYWAGITECLTPSYNYFYSNPAQYCQEETTINFSDTWASELGTVWPGLDYRFLDYYSAYMYGYFNIATEGTYSFYLTSDDGALFYVDDLNTPVVDREGCRSKSTTEGSKTLSTGKHLFAIRFFEFNEAAVLGVEYACPLCQITRRYADTSILKVGGRGPSFVEYPLITGFVDSDLITYQPTRFSGAVSSWAASSALPGGIAMDPATGYISGRPTTTVNAVYTITATGYVGIATAPVHIIIATQPQSGLYAKYYKITDSSFCSYKALSGNQIDLKYIKVDNGINHPAANPVIPWDGLTSDFNNNFYVIWEGYVHHDVIGSWGLRLTCDDGCKLLLKNNNELINHWGCHGYTSSSTQRDISSVGYYYYKIEYQQSTGQGGILFEWRKPNHGWETVPNDKIFHSPPSLVSYEYQMAHYFKDVAINENRPLVFTNQVFTSYSVQPALPQGLSLSSQTGIISGTPTEVRNIGDYTITCTSSAGQEKVVISLDVYFVLAPSGLTVSQGGVVKSSFSVIAYQAITDIVVNNPTTAEITAFSIAPDLPNGLTISAATGTISGTPSVSIEATVFTMSATNSGGSFFFSFTLTISGCKGTSNGQAWEGKYYTFHLLSGAATVSMRDSANTVIACGKGSVDASGFSVLETCTATLSSSGTDSMTLCLPPTTGRNIYVHCTDEGGCDYQFFREDGYYYPIVSVYSSSSSAPYTYTAEFSDALPPLTAIEFSEQDIIAYSGFDIDTCYILPNGAYKAITITPSLADGITTLTRPRISGIAYGEGDQDFVVSIVGESGTITKTLTVHFTICNEEVGKTVVSFQAYTYFYAGEQSYALFKDGVKLWDVNCYYANTLYTVSACLARGSYAVKLYDSWGDGWGPADATYLNLRDSSNVLLKRMTFVSGTGDVEDPTKVKTETFTISVIDLSAVKWLALIGSRPSRNWMNLGESHNDWREVTFGTVGQWGSRSACYFVHDFTLTNAREYPLLKFTVYFRDGLIVYLNGNEVYRRNLPSSASDGTLATGQYDGFYERVGTAPGHLLVSGVNRIAIAMHRHATTTGAIPWKSYVEPLEGTCIPRIDNGYITKSLYFTQASETAAAAWDGNTATSWIENGLPAWTTWSYNYDRVEWVNKVILGSATRYPESDPVLINIYGSNDGTAWGTPLLTIHKKGIWTARGQTAEFMMLDHYTAFGHYKVEIMESFNGGGRTGLSVIDLQSCQLTYCPSDGIFGGVYAGATSITDCAEGYIGERYRVCGTAEYNPSWGAIDTSECRSTNPPRGTVYIDVAYTFTGISLETMKAEAGENIRFVFAEVNGLVSKTVVAWKYKDVTDTVNPDPVPASVIYLRTTETSKNAATALTSITACTDVLLEKLQSVFGGVFTKDIVVDYYLTPKLQEPKGLDSVNGVMLTIVIVLVVVILAVAAFYIWVRTKSRKTKNGSRQLKSGSRKPSKHSSGKSIPV